jgi:protein lifeguard
MYVMVALVMCTSNYRGHPHNLIFLVLFTLCFSYLISQVTSVYAYYYGGPLVLTAAALTLFMVLGLTLFAVFSRENFKALFGAIIVLFFSFAGFGFLCLITLEPVLDQLYCAITVSILGVLLVIDTKMIIGGERSIGVSMDDYVLGSLILYIDIMWIIIWFLRLLLNVASKYDKYC